MREASPGCPDSWCASGLLPLLAGNADVHCCTEWDGGLVLVSHDFRLISQVAREIWEVNDGVHRWEGSIESYKDHLKKTHTALVGVER